MVITKKKLSDHISNNDSSSEGEWVVPHHAPLHAENLKSRDNLECGQGINYKTGARGRTGPI